MVYFFKNAGLKAIFINESHLFRISAMKYYIFEFGYLIEV